MRSFEIVRALGTGGMATVHLALLREGPSRRMVAIKTLHPYLVENAACARLLEHEARLAARIRHPNVVAVTDYFDAGPAPVMVMEWVDGVDLGRLMRAVKDSDRRLPLDVVAAIACDLLAGLHAAHETVNEEGTSLGIVHRDVSPQNVLVGLDGVSRVTDFGIAKAAFRSRRTQTGAIKGKLAYLAPEQLDARCDRRSDIYSAGVVLWELLCGTRMRTSEGIEMLVEILYAYVDRPSARAPEAAPLDEVIMHALEHSADDRFATAAEMRAEILYAITPAEPARVGRFVAEVLRAADRSSDRSDGSDDVTLVERAAA